MGRSPKVSSTRKPPRSIFDILHFIPIRLFRAWPADVGHEELREQWGLAVAWQPNELRAFHASLTGKPRP